MAIFRKFKEFFSRRKNTSETDLILKDIRAVDPRDLVAKPGQITTHRIIPGSVGDLFWHLTRSLKPALMQESKLSNAGATMVLERLCLNPKIRTAFYEYVRASGKKRDAIRQEFVSEVNRTLNENRVVIALRISNAISMVVDHHDH